MSQIRGSSLILALALILRAILGFHGLIGQGLRNVDEGYYAFQGLAICLGIEHGVWNKPGHDLLIAAGYKLLGTSMATPLIITSLLSFLTILAVYRIVEEADSALSGAFSALAFATAPTILLYARSAYSESNYVSLTLWGILLHLWGSKAVGDGMRSWRTLSLFAGAGGLWGWAVTANEAALPSIVFYLLPATGVIIARRDMKVGSLLIPSAVMAMGFATVAGGVMGTVWLSGLLNEERFLDSLRYHARHGGESGLTIMGPVSLVKFGMGIPLLFAGLGVFRLWRRKVSLQIPLFGLALLAFYLRMSVTNPRIFLPLTIPVVLLAGPGLTEILERVAQRVRWGRRSLGIGWVLLFAIPQSVAAWKILPGPSGYEESCSWLVQDRVTHIVTTHSWWTFLCFAGCRSVYGSDTIARMARGESFKEDMVRFMAKAHRDGCSHLVLDFLLWNRLRAEDTPKLEEFIRTVPPDKVIPNLVAKHEQTFLEDGDIPDLREIPLSWNIYIYRLERFQGSGLQEPKPLIGTD